MEKKLLLICIIHDIRNLPALVVHLQHIEKELCRNAGIIGLPSEHVFFGIGSFSIQFLMRTESCGISYNQEAWEYEKSRKKFKRPVSSVPG